MAILKRFVRTRQLDRSAVAIGRLQPRDVERFFEPIERPLAEQWLAKQECGELYVAVAEVYGLPVGRRCLSFKHHPETRVGFCFAASVLPQWQSRGIGSMLDAHLAEVALARGFRALRCVVEKSNPRSRAWHEKLGYRAIGERIAHWVEADGREVTADCWEFERPLGP